MQKQIPYISHLVSDPKSGRFTPVHYANDILDLDMSDPNQSELLRPIKIRPWMYVRRSIMHEKAAFCSPKEYNSVAR